MKQDDVIPYKAKLFQRLDDGGRIFIEVGDNNNDAATMQQSLKVSERLEDVCTGPRFSSIECRQQPSKLPWTRSASNYGRQRHASTRRSRTPG